MSLKVNSIPMQRFQADQLAKLNPARIPQHISIIPDGNRRWAKQRMMAPENGHREGADTFLEIVQAAQELGVKFLTIYSFSTENWSRPPEEVEALMAIIAANILDQRENMIEKGIKLETIGDLNKLPEYLRDIISDSKSATAHCQGITLILALNYGSRDEMCRAFKSMLEDYDRKQLSKEDINEEVLSSYLDTDEWPDPDLFIRTSGEFRISNFLLWQASYSEIYVAPVLWPDFTPQHLLEAILNFQTRDRRWGGN